jgi:NAD(P)-dependent dehydrogenase (short-subunit alcohol dehydrogenase family)
LSSRVALVTGASGDIGRAVCAALAAAEVEVIAVSRRRAPTDAGGRIVALAADLTLATGRATVAEAVARRGRLDLLVLGSGIYRRSDDPAVLAEQFAANVEAPYALLRAVLPQLREAAGYAVFINSTQGLAAAPEVGQFAATQHAMRAIADSFRGEVNAQGVRVASIFLGRTATTRQAAIFAAEGRAYPPERLLQPADVAGVVLMLLNLPPTAEVTSITLRPRLKT